MPLPDWVGHGWRWLRRLLAALLLAGVVTYLIGGWLRADDDPDERTQMTIREGWPLLRPTWLYAAVLVAILLSLLLALGLAVARRQASRSGWREQVRAQVQTLRHELAIRRRTPPKGTEPQVDTIAAAVLRHLRAAHDEAAPEQANQRWEEEPARDEAPPDPPKRQSSPNRLVDAWSGAAVRAAFLNLHAAEVAMVPLLSEEQIAARIPEALARLEKLPKTDQRRRDAEAQVRKGVPGPKRRAAYAEAVRLGHEIKDTRHTQVRSFRNIVYATTAALWAVVVLLCVVGASFPDAIPLCFTPSDTTTTTTTTTPPGTTTTRPATTTTTQPQPTPAGGFSTVCPSEEQPPAPSNAARRLPAPGDVSLTALFGLLGGALSGAFAIRNLQGTSTPYSVPVALSLLKLPSGALTAIVGILLVRGEFIPGLSQLDNQPQILAYAFVFGVAQQVATRYVDARGQQILSAIPSKAAGDRTKGSTADPEEAPEPPPLTTSAEGAEQGSQRRFRRSRP